MLAVSTALAGCGRGDDWQASAGSARVCVDSLGRRLPDQACSAHTGGYGGPVGWYYLNASTVRNTGIPAIGGAVSGGSSAPGAGVSYHLAPAGGIARGGFGATAEGVGGHGAGE